jgi:hypothetical protein
MACFVDFLFSFSYVLIQRRNVFKFKNFNAWIPQERGIRLRQIIPVGPVSLRPAMANCPKILQNVKLLLS